MSRLELYLTPLQWEEISTYEARVKIITLCEERLVIECKNSMACSKLTGTNLPEPLKMKPRNFSLINKMTLSIENPKFFFIKCVMYCSYTNQHIKSSDGEEIKISKQWGNPDSSLNHYSILGMLDWPDSSISELTFASDQYIKMSFEEIDLQPPIY